MLGICITCSWTSDNIEQHHVAGRHNYPTLTVPVCLDCHQILTRWQQAHGIELAADAAREPVDQVRALVAGVFDLFRLLGQRHPDRLLISHALSQLNGRALSHLFDQFAPPDRPGRWLPDPTQPPTEATPVPFVEETEMDLLVLYATLTLQFLDLFEDPAPQHQIQALRQLIANPHEFQAAWRQLTDDQARAEALMADLQAQLERSLRVVRWMLSVDRDNIPDPETLEEIRIWFDTGRRLLERLVMLAYGAHQGAA